MKALSSLFSWFVKFFLSFRKEPVEEKVSSVSIRVEVFLSERSELIMIPMEAGAYFHAQENAHGVAETDGVVVRNLIIFEMD